MDNSRVISGGGQKSGKVPSSDSFEYKGSVSSSKIVKQTSQKNFGIGLDSHTSNHSVPSSRPIK